MDNNYNKIKTDQNLNNLSWIPVCSMKKNIHVFTQTSWSRCFMVNHVYVVSIVSIHLSRALWKRGLMRVRKVSSQIILSSPHRLIRDDTPQNVIFAKNRLSWNEKYYKSRKYRPWLAWADCTCLSRTAIYAHAFNPLHRARPIFIRTIIL